MPRRRTSLQSLVVPLLAPALFLGCDRDKGKRAVTTGNGHSTTASSNANAKARVLEALNSPYVLVANGKAAVVRWPTGCAVVVPSKTGVFKGGVRIYVAKSGDPREGAVLLVQ